MSFLRIPIRLVFLLLVMFSGVALAALFLRHKVSAGGIASTITRFWHRQVCRAFNIDVCVYGEQPTQAALLVSNHISWFDISALGSAISARYLSKHEVVGWPVVGWLAKKAGTLFIQRGASKAAQQAMSEMSTALCEGSHVVLFPEGTTTDGTTVRRFHSRLFQSAIDSEVMVQPVVIRYPHEYGVHPKAPLANDITLYESAIGMLGEPHMTVEIHFLPPLDSRNAKRGELAKACEQLIRQHIERHDVQGKPDAIGVDSHVEPANQALARVAANDV